MEKIFRSKGFTKTDRWLLLAALLLCVGLMFVQDITALGGFVAGIIIAIDDYTKKYIVKENGDLWVKNFFGVSQKAVGINRILYDPNAKGWRWRTRQMIIRYEQGLHKGFFPITPADPEGLIAVLKERNPGMELNYFEIPVNK